MPPLSLGSFILTRSPDSRNGKNDRKTETRKSPSERGRNYTPLGEVVHCALPGASCGQRMISVDFQSVPIITGEATLPLRWLRQLPLCELATRKSFRKSIPFSKLKLYNRASDKSQIVEVNVMWFWWFMLCCDLMIPLLMIVIGRLMWKRPPQKINSLIGYRTSRSMKNMDTWHFAHHYCGKLWWRIGWIILVPSLIIHLPFYGASDDAIGIVGLILTFIQIAVLIGSIFPTEKALKRTFTEEGLRR